MMGDADGEGMLAGEGEAIGEAGKVRTREKDNVPGYETKGRKTKVADTKRGRKVKMTGTEVMTTRVNV